MDAHQLLTFPASKLTRKQRLERAALKRVIAEQARQSLPPGYAVGEVRVIDRSVEPNPVPRPGHIIVNYADTDLGRFG
jgi:hypothetical protein